MATPHFFLRRLFAVCALLQTILAFGQEAHTMLPNYTPPSPEAFVLTKYGDVPTDEFNGKVKLDIPIYTYSAGHLQLPVSLEYYGAGVKVDDLPTQVGINWSLRAGGVVTREVRDLPDEYGILDMTLQDVTALNQADCTSQATQLLNIMQNTNTDTERDVFRFNFLEYSGTFYLDGMSGKLVKNDKNLKIDVIGTSLANDKTLRITDESGVRFYFGGANACEETYTRTITGSDQNMSPGGITSFYLYKIEHPVNGTIFLDYTTQPNYQIDLSRSRSTTRAVAGDDINNCSYYFSDVETTSQTKLHVIGNKLLQRIYSSDHNEMVLFNRTLTPGNNSFKHYLNNIEVRKGSNPSYLNGVLLSKSEFEYLGLENPVISTRFFLTKVLLNKALQSTSEVNKKYEEYQMEYNNPTGLPPRLSSYRMDMLGYFNNKNNANLYPCFALNDGTYAEDCPDRTANFVYASRGTLSRIYYPTGGYSVFEYEPQPGKTPVRNDITGTTFYNNGQEDQLVFNVPGTNASFQGEEPSIYVMPAINEWVNITFSFGDAGGIEGHHASRKLIIKDLTNNISSTISVNNTPYRFWGNHTYQLEFILTPPNTGTAPITDPYSANAGFSFSYNGGLVPSEGAGVRIKRISSVANGVNEESKKRYYYKPYDKLSSYDADLFSFVSRVANSGYMKQCATGMFLSTMIPVYTTTKYSDFISSDYNCSSVKYKDYACVTVSYGGDNFEQGGTEKTFMVSDDSGYFEVEPASRRFLTIWQNDFPNARYNSVSLDGLLIKEKFFSNIGGSIYKIKENTFNYYYPTIAEKTNFFSYNIYSTTSTSCPNFSTLSNNFIGGYITKSFDFMKTSDKEVLYVDPVPANLVADDNTTPYISQDQLEASYKKITTTKTYEYGLLKGLPTKINTSSSETGVSNMVRNYYANDSSLLSDLLPTQQAAYNFLTTQNMLLHPIQVEHYRNAELLSSQRITYKTQPGNKIVPQFIRTSKGNGVLEDRVVFDDYDSRGNPTAVRLKDGSVTKYVYNDRNQVVVKAENAEGINIGIPNWANACSYVNSYSSALITIYNYDPDTGKIIAVMEPNCQVTYYEYDSLHKLKLIKDSNHNIIKEFNNNYKP